jgi:FAD/FMN-containing dehydrogenase
MGTGMSQGKQAISHRNDNIVINTRLMNEILIDPKAKIAKVGPGATWCDIQKTANTTGLAVRVMQASNIFSIGGSLSVNCHGWDHKSGSLRNTVAAISIINSKGQLLRLTPNDELFDYVIGGYGWFGVIVEAEIFLTENVVLDEK